MAPDTHIIFRRQINCLVSQTQSHLFWLNHQNFDYMENTKVRILSAAEELISQNGIENTTIAKIASKAQTSDSLVYQYFKGKEDLLFSIAAERIKEAIELLEDQLQGITDPESLLQKLVWYGLKYNDRHPGYVRILLFECRSNKDYYTSPAADLMRKHSKILFNVMKKGNAAGVFRNDINLNLLRDIIYGTFDFEAIGCIAMKEADQSHTDLEAIMELIRPMITTKTPFDENDKKSRIITAAEKTFAENGFSKAKITKIAKQAQVAEGTIYDYFKNKEDLLMSVSNLRLQQQLEDFDEALDIKSSEGKLRRMIRLHCVMFLLNRDFLKVFLLHNQLNISFYSSKAFPTYQKYLFRIEQVITEGKAQGCFRSDVNARVFRNMFLGAFSHMALRWTLFGRDQDNDKIMEINQLVDMLLKAVTN